MVWDYVEQINFALVINAECLNHIQRLRGKSGNLSLKNMKFSEWKTIQWVKKKKTSQKDHFIIFLSQESCLHREKNMPLYLPK